jgi:hypothetical protein
MKPLVLPFILAALIPAIGFTQPTLTLWITPDADHYHHDHHDLVEYACLSSYYIYYHNLPDTLHVFAKNEGTEPLNISGASTETIEGAHFELLDFTPMVLMPGEMQDISIAYLLPPQYVSGVNGQITLESNDPEKESCTLYFDIGCTTAWVFHQSPFKGVPGNCSEPVIHLDDFGNIVAPNMLFEPEMEFYSYDSDADTSVKVMHLVKEGVYMPGGLAVEKIFLAGEVVGQDATFRVTPQKVDIDGVLEVDLMTSPSDRRRKRDIAPINNATEKIMSLSPKSYFLQDTSIIESRQYGFIAQDLESILPEIVHAVDGDMKSVNYLQIIPWLTAALQEQQGVIEKLQDRLSELESGKADQ